MMTKKEVAGDIITLKSSRRRTGLISRITMPEPINDGDSEEMIVTKIMSFITALCLAADDQRKELATTIKASPKHVEITSTTFSALVKGEINARKVESFIRERLQKMNDGAPDNE